MKKKLLLLIFVISIIGIIFIRCSSKKEEIEAIKERGTLNVGVKIDVPKFGYKNPETEKIEGFEVEIAKEIARNILGKADVNLKSVNTKTRGLMLDNDEVDIVVATFTITEERKKAYNFSKSYFSDAVQLLVKKEDGYKSLIDLDKKIIGVSKSSTTKEVLEKEAKKQSISFDFVEYDTFSEIKSDLLKGKVDCFSVDGAILEGYVDDETEILKDRYAEQEYGVAVKKSNVELAERVDEIINEMLMSGKIDDLIDEIIN